MKTLRHRALICTHSNSGSFIREDSCPTTFFLTAFFLTKVRIATFWTTNFSTTKLVLVATVITSWVIASQVSAQSPSEDQILQAFAETSQGYSSDELLLQDDLRTAFLRALSNEDLKPAEQRESLLRLLRLRKTGKLKTKATRRGKPVAEGIAPIAEIACRVVTDRHRVTSDTMLADPTLRAELQQEAEKIAPGIDAYAVRKSVLQLRKKRSLKPELVLQVAHWDREVKTYGLAELREALENKTIADQPGIYLFRNRGGYLYVGEAKDLAARLEQHLSGSHSQSLTEYLSGKNANSVSIELHIFPADSPAKQTVVRRAYESELIRSRKPSFNVRP